MGDENPIQERRVYIWGSTESRRWTCYGTVSPEGIVGSIGAGGAEVMARAVRGFIDEGYKPVLGKKPDGEDAPLDKEARKAFDFIE